MFNYILIVEKIFVLFLFIGPTIFVPGTMIEAHTC